MLYYFSRYFFYSIVKPQKNEHVRMLERRIDKMPDKYCLKKSRGFPCGFFTARNKKSLQGKETAPPDSERFP